MKTRKNIRFGLFIICFLAFIGLASATAQINSWEMTSYDYQNVCFNTSLSDDNSGNLSLEIIFNMDDGYNVMYLGNYTNIVEQNTDIIDCVVLDNFGPPQDMLGYVAYVTNLETNETSNINWSYWVSPIQPDPQYLDCNGDLNVTLEDNGYAQINITNNCNLLGLDLSANTIVDIVSDNSDATIENFEYYTTGQYISPKINILIDDLTITNLNSASSSEFYGNGNNNFTILNFLESTYGIYYLENFNKLNFTAPNDGTRYMIGSTGMRNINEIYLENIYIRGDGSQYQEIYDSNNKVFLEKYLFGSSYPSLSSYTGRNMYILMNIDVPVTEYMKTIKALNWMPPQTGFNTGTSIISNHQYTLPSLSSYMDIENNVYEDNYWRLYGSSMNMQWVGTTIKSFGFNTLQFMNVTNISDFETNFNIVSNTASGTAYINYSGTLVGNRWLDVNGDNLYDCNTTTSVIEYNGMEVEVCDGPILIDSKLSDYIIVDVRDIEEDEDDTSTTSGGSSGGSSTYQPATKEMDNTIEEVEEVVELQAFSFFNEDGELDFSQVESISTKTGVPYSDVGIFAIPSIGLGYLMRKTKFTRGNSKKAKKTNRWIKVGLNIIGSGFIYMIVLTLFNTFA